MNDKTRPCRPGDILASGEVPCGAFYKIEVDKPDPHPASGTVDVERHDVGLILWVELPAGENRNLRADLRSLETVLNESLNIGWGNCSSPGKTRYRAHRLKGPAIAPLLTQLQQIGSEAIAKVQQVADAHAASVAAQASARAAAYAAWPVREEGAV